MLAYVEPIVRVSSSQNTCRVQLIDEAVELPRKGDKMEPSRTATHLATIQEHDRYLAQASVDRMASGKIVAEEKDRMRIGLLDRYGEARRGKRAKILRQAD